MCADCGKVEPFADPGLEAALERVAGGRGYDIAAHEVVLRGYARTAAPEADARPVRARARVLRGYALISIGTVLAPRAPRAEWRISPQTGFPRRPRSTMSVSFDLSAEGGTHVVQRIRHHLHGEGGFAGIEALVVVVLLGVALAVAVPSFLGLRGNSADGKTKASLRAAMPRRTPTSPTTRRTTASTRPTSSGSTRGSPSPCRSASAARSTADRERRREDVERPRPEPDARLRHLGDEGLVRGRHLHLVVTG